MIHKIIFSCFTAITVFFNYSFSQEKSDEAILSGLIKNGKQKIELRSYYNTLDKSKRKIIPLDKDGAFHDTINIQKNELYLIGDGTNFIPFYLTPSSTYYIEYDSKKFKSEGATLRGDDITINEYFTDKIRHENFSDTDLVGKSEEELRGVLTNIKDKQLERLHASELPLSLKIHERASIKYEYLRNLFLNIGLNKIDNPSTESENELNIDYSNEEDYKKYAAYKYLVSDYYNTELRHKEKEYQKLDPLYSLNQNAIKELASIVPNEHIKNDLIASTATFYLLDSKDPEACYNDFKEYYTGNDTNVKAEMSDLYYRLTKLKKGMPSPRFNNLKNYNGGVNSLDDFKGKFIFINIWATWCGNCYGEMPALKELEKEFSDVTFINIAWKDDEDKWRKTIKRKLLSGTQLFATNENNSFFEEYGVSAIPQYILIDPKGNIVDHSAPRPSDDKLKALFKRVGLD